MSEKYPNWSKEDWPWVKGSWACNNVPRRNETVSLWYFGGIPIESADFVFPKSKYEGFTLSEMVRHHPKALELHMLHSNIYIFPHVIKHLNVTQQQRRRLIRVVESYLTFDEINPTHPHLHSKTYESNYDGLTIEQIINEDSQYLPYVIKHAEGRCMIDLYYLNDLIEKSTSPRVTSVLLKCFDYVEEILEKQRDAEEAYEREIAYMQEQEELRYWQNEGYREAFDGDSEAEWNID